MIEGINNLEYLRSLQLFDQKMALVDELVQKAHEAQTEAMVVWGTLEDTRQRSMVEHLKAQQLSICPESHWSRKDKGKDLGLFPTSEGKLFYRSFWRSRGTGPNSSPMGFELLQFLCPRHFPFRQGYFSAPHVPGKENFFSEVIEAGGQFFTIIGQKPIPLEVEQPRFTEALFEHFGFPKLPEYPRAIS